MGTLFDNFKYEPDGSTTLANSVCFFIKEQIVFGDMKGGDIGNRIGNEIMINARDIA